MKPGPGWKKLSNSVYEHISGTRIHTGGLVRTPNGDHWLNSNEGQDGRLLVTMNGGNKKRGLMAWAVQLINKV